MNMITWQHSMTNDIYTGINKLLGRWRPISIWWPKPLLRVMYRIVNFTIWPEPD